MKVLLKISDLTPFRPAASVHGLSGARDGVRGESVRGPIPSQRPRLLLLLAALVAGSVLLTGCVSHHEATRQERRAYEEGRQTVLREQSPEEPVVLFRGDVRNQRVPWREGLTLAEGLLAAQYTWGWDPRLITVTRKGQAYPINPKALLRGVDNPVLEAGDVVEVRH